MSITQRPYSGDADKHAMALLVNAFPNSNLHVADLPYRLSSWALDDPDNIRLWFSKDNQLIAWAVLQSPFWTFDYAYSPETGCNLHQEIIAWADSRAQKILGSDHGRPSWFINVFAQQKDRIADLEILGFRSQANVGEDSWSKVLMTRSRKTPIIDCECPLGFIIRPLAGENEVEEYVKLHQATFESKNMTVDWRLRMLNHPNYHKDLDLVAFSPHGRMVAFCICWHNTVLNFGQIEPLGVHNDFRNLGLGRVLLTEGIQRLTEGGAARLFAETDSYRNEAFKLYEAAGFRVEKDVLVFRKDYNEREA